MPNTKPFVVVATACEKVLVEKDGVCSIIRMVDTFFIPELPPGAPPNAGIEINALITFKSGDLKGKFEFALRARKSDGTMREIAHRWPVLFKGEEHGTNVIVKLQIPHSELGLFWIDVLWDEEPIASFPVKLVRGEGPAATNESDTSSP